jgi:hypothetical protein
MLTEAGHASLTSGDDNNYHLSPTHYSDIKLPFIAAFRSFPNKNVSANKIAAVLIPLTDDLF